MANFADALAAVYEFEGGYANDPDDYGGETYRGISRRYQPTWPGWDTIDRLKDRFAEGFVVHLDSDERLQEQVRTLYKERFWNKLWGDQIECDAVAAEMLDIAVNLGTSRAVRFLQKSLNALSKDGRLWRQLAKDGKMGPNTFAALQEALEHGDAEYIVLMLNILQGNHYYYQTEKRPRQGKFLRGWLKRVSVTKDYQLAQ